MPPPGAGWGRPIRTDYAHWGRRVGAYLIDFLPGMVGSVFIYIWYFQFLFRMFGSIRQEESPFAQSPVTPTLIIGLVIIVLSYGLDIWNRFLLAGRTGQSFGKRALKIRLISEETSRPIGAVNAFLRDLLHVLDGAAYVGFLWPLWDEKRQTFADKLIKSIVVNAPVNAGRTEQPGRAPSAGADRVCLVVARGDPCRGCTDHRQGGDRNHHARNQD